MNPLYGLAKSWELTRGNSLMIIAFLLVVGIALFTASALIAGIAAALGGLVGGGVGAQLLAAVLAGIPTAMAGVALTAGIYRTIQPFDPADVFA